jgi:hypothetical protein
VRIKEQQKKEEEEKKKGIFNSMLGFIGFK